MDNEQNQLKKKKSIIIYESMIEATQGLSDKSIAELWRAFQKYINGEEIAFETMEAKLAWNFIVLQLDEAKMKWDETCKKRAKAGRNGAEKRWNNHMANNSKNSKCHQTMANDSKGWQSMANIADNDNEDDIYKKENIVKEKNLDMTECGRSNFKPPTLEELEAYGKSKGFKATNYLDFWEFYESKGWFIGKNKMKSWQLALNRWERNQDNFNAQTKNNNSLPKLTAEHFRTLYRYKHRATLNLDFSADKERMLKLLSFDDERILQTSAYNEILEDLQNPFSEVSKYDKKLNIE